MPVKSACTHCYTQYTLKDSGLVGKTIRCQKCGKPFVVERLGKADEFDEDFEDYGGEEFGSMGDWPPANSPAVAGTSATSSKKKKKNSDSPGAWKTPAIMAAALVGCGAGIWGLVLILPAFFDSHESLVDDRIALMHDYIEAMEDLSVHKDGQKYQAVMLALMKRSDKIEERLLNLGTVDDKRIREVRDYIRDKQKDVLEDLKQRAQAAQSRLERTEPGGGVAVSLAGFSIAKFDLDWFLVEEFPEPQAGEEPDRELVRAYREAIRTLLHVNNSSNPASSLGTIQDLTAKFQSMRNTSGEPGMPGVHRPSGVSSLYFDLKLKTSVYLTFLIHRVESAAADSPDVVQELHELSTALIYVGQ